jgi:hypothetical protein
MLDWLRSVSPKRRVQAGKVVVFHHRRLVFGRFTIKGQLITVTTPIGSRLGHLAGMPAETVAKFLLRELADKGQA